MRRLSFCLLAGLLVLLVFAATAAAAELTLKEQLGKAIFFDTSLSAPEGMACATCHDPGAGFGDPRGGPTSAGVVPGRFGNRNSPTAAYAFGGPQFLTMHGDTYSGGTFWDGRADNLKEQAKGPFLNPLEMHAPNRTYVVTKVRVAPYAVLFRQVYATRKPVDVDGWYDRIADAVAAYERSSEVSAFTSKFDAYLEGKAQLTSMERMGWMVFNGKGRCSDCHFSGGMMQRCPGGCTCGCAVTGVCTCGPMCACGCPQAGACPGGCTCGCAFTGVCTCGTMCQCGCPNAKPACDGGCTCGCAVTGVCNCMAGAGCGCGCPSGGMAGGKPLFTNHGYFNVGAPANTANPFYTLVPALNPLGADWVDQGLGGVLAARGIEGGAAQMGKVKVPTLRNVAKTAPYMHNGVFATLMDVVHFYNMRDVPGATMPDGSPMLPPEVPENVNRELTGNLKLTPQEGMALIAFLNTLTDGYVPVQ